MKICFSICLVFFLTLNCYTAKQDSLWGNLLFVQKEHPEFFNPGVVFTRNKGQKYIVFCGYSERYFKDKSIEQEQELWEEAELDAKEQLYSYYQRKKKKNIKITLNNISSLFYWIKNKNLYYRNFAVLKDDLIINIPKPKLDKIKEPFIKRKNIKINTKKEKLKLLLLEAESLFYSEKYCSSVKKYNDIIENGGVHSKESKIMKKTAILFCKYHKNKLNINNIKNIADKYYIAKDFRKSFAFYKKIIDIVYKRERWLKNVDAEVLYKFGVSALKLKFTIKAKNLFETIRQFHPTSKYWQLAKIKVNNL